MSKETTSRVNNQEEIVSIFRGLDSEGIQELLKDRAKRAALSFGLELLELDVLELCGERYSHNEERDYWRYGSERTKIHVGGGKYSIKRPRVRGAEGEAELPSLKKLKNRDLLDDEMKEKMLMGVSTRNYSEVIDGYEDRLGVSKSNISRAFIRASKKDLEVINHGDLREYSFIGLVIDGIELKGRTVVALMGVTSELEKIPLGLGEGSTENSSVVIDLLQSLPERHFTIHTQKLLCVLDGSKALRKAVKAVFGDAVLIQRCWIHKLRNLEGYVPKAKHPELRMRMNRLMHLDRYRDATKELQSFHRWLMQISEQAANSLNEAGEQLLTLCCLKVPLELRKSLDTTNVIESLFSVVRRKTRNVKHWSSRTPERRKAWVAAAILQHQKKMRKLRGVEHKQVLINALGRKLDEDKISA